MKQLLYFIKRKSCFLKLSEMMLKDLGFLADSYRSFERIIFGRIVLGVTFFLL